MEKFFTALFGCLFLIVVWAASGAIAGWIVEWAWNLLIPSIFHGPRIDFWQAYALYVLISVVAGIIKGFSE